MRERSPGTWELTVSAGVGSDHGPLRAGHPHGAHDEPARGEGGAGRLEVEVAGGHVGSGSDGGGAARAVDGASRAAGPLRLDALQLPARTSTGSSSRPSATSGCRSSRPATWTGCTRRCAGAGWRRRRSARSTPSCGQRCTRPCGGDWSAATSRRWRRRRRSRSGSSIRRRPTRCIALIDAADALDPMFGSVRPGRGGHRHAPGRGVRAAVERRRPRRRAADRAAQPSRRCRAPVGDRPTKTRSVRTITLDPGTVAALGRAGGRPASWPASPAWTTTPAGPATCSASTPTAPRRGGATRSPPAGRAPAGAAGVDGRPAARPAPLAGHPAARRRRSGAHGRRPARPRRRHDDDEDLRPPHRASRRAGRRSRRRPRSVARPTIEEVALTAPRQRHRATVEAQWKP